MDILQAGLEGLRRAEAGLEKSARRIAEMPISWTGEPVDLVDLSAEFVAMAVAKNSAEASIQVMETAQEVAKSTLDVLG